MNPTARSNQPLFWLQPHSDRQQPPENENSPIFLLPEPLAEIQTPIILTIATLISTLVLESTFFQTCFVISCAHLAGRLVKKVFTSYSFMQSIEDQALTFTRRMPYLYVLLVIIAFLFAWHVPAVSLSASITLGIVSALAIEMYAHSAAIDAAKPKG